MLRFVPKASRMGAVVAYNIFAAKHFEKRHDCAWLAMMPEADYRMRASHRPP